MLRSGTIDIEQNHVCSHSTSRVLYLHHSTFLGDWVVHSCALKPMWSSEINFYLRGRFYRFLNDVLPWKNKYEVTPRTQSTASSWEDRKCDSINFVHITFFSQECAQRILCLINVQISPLCKSYELGKGIISPIAKEKNWGTEFKLYTKHIKKWKLIQNLTKMMR